MCGRPANRPMRSPWPMTQSLPGSSQNAGNRLGGVPSLHQIRANGSQWQWMAAAGGLRSCFQDDCTLTSSDHRQSKTWSPTSTRSKGTLDKYRCNAQIILLRRAIFVFTHLGPIYPSIQRALRLQIRTPALSRAFAPPPTGNLSLYFGLCIPS